MVGLDIPHYFVFQTYASFIISVKTIHQLLIYACEYISVRSSVVQM